MDGSSGNSDVSTDTTESDVSEQQLDSNATSSDNEPLLILSYESSSFEELTTKENGVLPYQFEPSDSEEWERDSLESEGADEDQHERLVALTW